MSQAINKSRIVKNTIFLYIRMFVVMLVTLYTSRVVLDVLGVEDYGIYNVVAGSVAFFGFMNSAMSMATQRFFNYYMVGHDKKLLQKIFIMSVNIHLIITVLVVFLTETVGVWILETQLNIPYNRIISANYVFQLAIISFCISIIQVPYNAAILAHEKMNIYAVIGVLEVLLKLFVVFLLTNVDMNKLVLYSGLLVLVQLFIFVLYFIYVTYSFEIFRYKFSWDNKLFKEIASFSSWNVLGQIAQVLTIQGVNMVANIFCGVIINASIGITNQVNGAMMQFANNFQASFRSQIVKSYSVGDIENMEKLVFQASKFSFFLLYLVSIPVIYNIEYVLDLWLNNVPEYSAIFCKLLIWYSYIEVIGMPLVISILASGNNRNYQFVISVIISLNVFFVYLLLTYKFSPEYIFYIKILLALFVLITRVLFVNKQLRFSVVHFMKSALYPILIVVVLVSIVQNLFDCFEQIRYKLLSTFLIEIFCLGMIWIYGLTKNERSVIKEYVLLKIINK